jgi:mannose-6-phosphate isomerase-like protein (cupin superfamily)
MRALVSTILLTACLLAAADVRFLRRQIADVQPQPDGKGAMYKPLFGAGDKDADQLKVVVRCGELTVQPGGASAAVSYPDEEQLYFVTEGAGTLIYGDEKAAIRRNDFMYLPIGVKHGIANSSEAPVKVLVMGYRVDPAKVQPVPKLMLANADDVQLQVLGSHGPTTQFKLLMGQTTSRRDRLASAAAMNSLFIMDFAPGGTNIPHNHAAEEEIYILLRGRGDMVAGLDAEKKEVRHPVTPGAAFFFKPGTQVGYYSDARPGQEHDLILAARNWAR